MEMLDVKLKYTADYRKELHARCVKAAELIPLGIPYGEIAKRVGLSRGQVSAVPVKFGIINRGPRTGPKVGSFSKTVNKGLDWKEIQRYYDDGHTVVECCKQFDINVQTLSAATKLGVFKQNVIDNESLKNENVNLPSAKLLFRKLAEPVCSECGMGPEWRGKPLTLQVHHKDGIPQNNHFDNLCFLCPNCHAQTDSYGFKSFKQETPESTVKRINLAPEIRALKAEGKTVPEIFEILRKDRPALSREVVWYHFVGGRTNRKGGYMVKRSTNFKREIEQKTSTEILAQVW